MAAPDDDKIDASFLDSIGKYVTFEDVLTIGWTLASFVPYIGQVKKGVQVATVVYKTTEGLVRNGVRMLASPAGQKFTGAVIETAKRSSPLGAVANLPVVYKRLLPVTLSDGKTQVFKGMWVRIAQLQKSKPFQIAGYGAAAYTVYEVYKGIKDAIATKDEIEEKLTKNNPPPLVPTKEKPTIPTWQIDPKKRVTKVIEPLTGVVVPLVKILHVNPKNKQLSDLSLYLRIISISWVDRNEKYLDSFVLTCAYHPDLTKLDASFVVYPVVGTHLKENLALGLFYLARIKKDLQAGNPVVTLVFSSYKFDSPSSRELVSPKVCVAKSYHAVIANHAQKLGYKFEYDDHEELFDLYAIPGEKPMTWLEMIESIAHYLDMEFKIAKKTFYLRKRSSNKGRIQYYIHLTKASSFSYAKDLTNSYDSAEVISSVLPKENKVLRGVAGQLDSSGNPTGKVLTKYVDYSWNKKEQAKKEAVNLLNRVNSSITSCTLTIPNCVIFAGHNIVVDQSTADFDDEEEPIELRIREVKHEISPSGWFATLTLDEIKIDDLTKKTEAAKDIRTQTKKINEEIIKLYECSTKEDWIDDFLDQFEKRYNLVATKANLAPKNEPSGYDLHDLLVDKVLDMKRIFDLPQELRNHKLIKCIISFLESADKVNKELAAYEANLDSINKPAERYVQAVFDKISNRAFEKWGLK